MGGKTLCESIQGPSTRAGLRRFQFLAAGISLPSVAGGQRVQVLLPSQGPTIHRARGCLDTIVAELSAVRDNFNLGRRFMAMEFDYTAKSLARKHRVLGAVEGDSSTPGSRRDLPFMGPVLAGV